jgi:transcriptional regulator with XRE-family HTH domain
LVEKGKNGGKVDILVILADYFGVTLDYLICSSEERTGMEGVFL